MKVKAKKVKPIKESVVQKSIMDYLRLKGFIIVKVNNGGVYIKKLNRYMKSPQRGISDLIGMTPTGRFIAIEVKRPGSKPSPEQLSFIESVQQKGGIAFWTDSLDKVISIVE